MSMVYFQCYWNVSMIFKCGIYDVLFVKVDMVKSHWRESGLFSLAILLIRIILWVYMMVRVFR